MDRLGDDREGRPYAQGIIKPGDSTTTGSPGFDVIVSRKTEMFHDSAK